MPMKNHTRYSDLASLATIVLTFILFFMALFYKGFTHDMLLEAGVFLVSVKLILMSHRQNASTAVIEKTLGEVNETLRQLQSKDQPNNK